VNRAVDSSPESPTLRPRIEGQREQEILDAALTVLADVGYDRLTMDAVAQAAHASKATLYRRWNGKLALIIDALKTAKGTANVPDTGCLRDDLLASYCAPGGITDRRSVDTMASVLTAMTRDPDFAEAFRREIVAPKMARAREIYARAQERGEIRPDVDLDLVGPALAGIVLHRHYLLGDFPDQETVGRVLDQIILPAVRPHPTQTANNRPTTAKTTASNSTGSEQ
jgi:AcrR family transcriptional regulator